MRPLRALLGPALLVEPLSLLCLRLLLKDLLQLLLLLPLFLSLLHLVLHRHELLDLHAVLDLVFAFAAGLLLTLLLEAFLLEAGQLLLLEPRVSLVIFLLPLADALALLCEALERLQVAFAFPLGLELVIARVSLNELLPVLLLQVEALALAELRLLLGALALQPLVKLFLKADVGFAERLGVATRALLLSLVVLVLVGQSVLDEDVLAVNDVRGGELGLLRARLLAPEQRVVPAEAPAVLLELVAQLKGGVREEGAREDPRHVVLEGLLELKDDFFELGDELLLPGEDAPLLLHALVQVKVYGVPEFLLAGEPLGLFFCDPVLEVALRLLVRLDQDGVLVEFEVVHGLHGREDRLDAVELGEAEGLRPVGVRRRALP